MDGQRVPTEVEARAYREAAERTQTKFAAVEIVVTQVTNNTIEFSIHGDKALRKFKATWGDVKEMWAAWPSSLPSEATADRAGPPPKEQAFGKLYLSREYLKAHNIIAEPKWPPLLPELAPPTSELQVYPLRLELTGQEMRSGHFVQATIDLLDKNSAARTQTITLDGSSPVTVSLTAKSFADFLLPFMPDNKLIGEALAALTSQKDGDWRQLAHAWSVVAAAASSIASSDDAIAKLSDDTRLQLARFLSLPL